MHITLARIQEQLNMVVSQLNSTVPNDEPFGNATGHWGSPGLTRTELVGEAQLLLSIIKEHDVEEIDSAADERLQDYVRRLQHLHTETIPALLNNAGQAVSAYILTIQGLRQALSFALRPDDHTVTAAKLRKMMSQVRSMEARLKDLQPRTTSLEEMVSRIESAHDAADQLPTDLASLAEASERLEGLIQDATKNHEYIKELRGNADGFDARLRQSTEDAKSVLERCETAYSAATSVGLAAAFTERSGTLSRSMWIWVVGLIAALVTGSYFGSSQLHALSELFQQPNVTTSVVILNLMLSLLSVGAPVWFGWLATKQIGQRFRLAEDYAFKASISRAYEGFRREAARVDKDMEARLLASALTRLDELPLRLVEANSYGSPWHELASSELVKNAMRAVPGFAEQVKELAAKATKSVTPVKTNPPAPSATEEAS